MVDRGYREFVIDLENCAMMDSTFMGTMAGVALRLKELGQGHLHVIHCGGRSRELALRARTRSGFQHSRRTARRVRNASRSKTGGQRPR